MYDCVFRCSVVKEQFLLFLLLFCCFWRSAPCQLCYNIMSIWDCQHFFSNFSFFHFFIIIFYFFNPTKNTIHQNFQALPPILIFCKSAFPAQPDPDKKRTVLLRPLCYPLHLTQEVHKTPSHHG